MRRSEFRGYNDPQVCIELEVPDHDVLLSNEDMWHVVLNDGHYGNAINEQEYDADSASDQNEHMLSQIILGYPAITELRMFCDQCADENCDGCVLDYPDAYGRHLPEIIALFWENGFDTSKDDVSM